MRGITIPRLIGATALVTLRLAAGPAYGDLPLVFEANVEQTETEVKFLARSQDVTVFLTSDGALIRRGASLVRMTLALLNDAATGWFGPLTPGAAASIQNSQCRINGGGTSVSASGDILAVTLSITFQAGFAGSKPVSMWAGDHVMGTGWQMRGTWTV